METEQTQSAAYLPFATFLTGLDHLAAVGLANKIEPSTFFNMNPTNKTQMVSALKFFGLIDKENVPQPLLDDLVHKQGQRKEIIRALIEKYYPDIVALDFAKMTPSQLDAALNGKQYNISGGTKKKAKAFLLKAAQFAGFTPHALLTKITRTRRKGTARQAGVRTNEAETNGSGATPAESVTQSPPKPRGTEKTVQLRSGAGSVTLLLDVDLMELEPGEEQDFVLKLRDLVRAYEKGSASSADEKGAVEKEAEE